jgi:hypothetical protein
LFGATKRVVKESHNRYWLRHCIWALFLGLLIACVGGCHSSSQANRVTVLNELRDDINANYGYMSNGTPRINCGPCARFAVAFREQWKTRFRKEVTLECVLSQNRKDAGHVAIKFSDGSYYDGGNGIMTEQQFKALFPNHPIEEMVEFDRHKLDQWVGGLDHDRYPECPDYSEDLTVKIIEKHLARLARD